MLAAIPAATMISTELTIKIFLDIERVMTAGYTGCDDTAIEDGVVHENFNPLLAMGPRTRSSSAASTRISPSQALHLKCILGTMKFDTGPFTDSSGSGPDVG